MDVESWYLEVGDLERVGACQIRGLHARGLEVRARMRRPRHVGEEVRVESRGLGAYGKDMVLMQAVLDLASPHRPPAEFVDVAAFGHEDVPDAQQASGGGGWLDIDFLHLGEIEPARLDVRHAEVRHSNRLPFARPRRSSASHRSGRSRVERGARSVPACAAKVGVDQRVHPLFEEVDELLLLGDQGVDAGGLGVQVVGDRPLLGQRWERTRASASASEPSSTNVEP